MPPKQVPSSARRLKTTEVVATLFPFACFGVFLSWPVAAVWLVDASVNREIQDPHWFLIARDLQVSDKLTSPNVLTTVFLGARCFPPPS